MILYKSHGYVHNPHLWYTATTVSLVTGECTSLNRSYPWSIIITTDVTSHSMLAPVCSTLLCQNQPSPQKMNSTKAFRYFINLTCKHWAISSCAATGLLFTESKPCYSTIFALQCTYAMSITKPAGLEQTLLCSFILPWHTLWDFSSFQTIPVEDDTLKNLAHLTTNIPCPESQCNENSKQFWNTSVSK